MNNIIYAGQSDGFDDDAADKYFEITVLDKKPASRENEVNPEQYDVSAAPPRCRRGERKKGLCVVIDQAVIPLKQAVIFKDEGIRHAALQAEKYFNSDAGNKNAVLAALGSLIIAYALSACGNKKYSPTVELVRADVSKNLSNSAYSLDDFLKNLPLNYDYVRKLFKKETGATPRDYLEGLRMELAEKLISSGVSNKYSNYTVSQIAEACGYTEPLYFSRVFKKHFGINPSDYRAKILS